MAIPSKLVWTKSTILIPKSAKYRNLQNFQLRFPKSKLAFHLSSRMIFLNLLKNHTPFELIRNSGQRIQTTKQENMA